MKKIYLLLCSIVFILSTSVAAMAFGIGVYGEMCPAGTSWGGQFGDSNDMIPMGGLVFDSAVAKNTIFNNRLKFGGGKMIGGRLTLTKVGFSNTFGLSPSNMRGDGARFWFGPRIAAYYLGGKVKVPPSLADQILFGGFAPYQKIKINLLRFDLGLTLLGFNFNFGEHATVSFEFGFDYGVMIGDSDDMINDIATGYEGFANVSFMYRVNDNYSNTTTKL